MMSDMAKVIKGLECCVRTIEDCECADNCPYETQCWDGTMYLDLMRDALELLKTQERVEPTEPDEDNTQYCGACGSAVGYEVLEPSGIGYIKYNYCPICGKAVKWDG